MLGTYQTPAIRLYFGLEFGCSEAPCQDSSVAEQLTRNEQVVSSNLTLG